MAYILNESEPSTPFSEWSTAVDNACRERIASNLPITRAAISELVEDLSVARKFNFVTHRIDSNRVEYRCASYQQAPHSCEWRIYASPSIEEDGSIVLQPRLCNLTHQCFGFNDNPSLRWTINKQTFLRRHIPSLIPITITTQIKTIIDTITLKFHEIPNYEAIRIFKASIVSGQMTEQARQFQKIPAYCARIEHECPGTTAHYEFIPLNPIDGGEEDVNHSFRRVFICPTYCSRATFLRCRPFIALDGTFLKTRWAMTLLIAVGIDGNGETVILAWGVVESESEASWTWFLNHLEQVLPEVCSSTIISDRGKGLLNAIRSLGPGVTQAFCCFHIKQNAIRVYGQIIETFFWRIVKSNTEEEYNNHLSKLLPY